MPGLFKVAFPRVKLPPGYGDQDGIVLMTVRHRTDPNFHFATVVSNDGQIFQGVPLHISILQAGLKDLVEMQEVPKGTIIAPSTGIPGLIHP